MANRTARLAVLVMLLNTVLILMFLLLGKVDRQGRGNWQVPERYPQLASSSGPGRAVA